MEPRAYEARYPYKPGDAQEMEAVTLQLLEEQIAATPWKQLQFFNAHYSGEVLKAYNFWYSDRGDASESLNRQPALRNFVRTLMAALEGVIIVAIKHLRESGMTIDRPKRLLRGDHEEVAETMLQVAVDFSRRFGQAEELPTNSFGFRELAMVRRLNKRITHPDEVAQLRISGREAEGAVKLARWYSHELLPALMPDPGQPAWLSIRRSVLIDSPRG